MNATLQKYVTIFGEFIERLPDDDDDDGDVVDGNGNNNQNQN